MPFQLLIPATLASAFAAGDVTLMTTAAGATTTLVGASGTIVGTAALVPTAGVTASGATVLAGSGGAAGATAAAGAATLVLPIALAVGGAMLVGGGCFLLYRRHCARKAVEEPLVLTIGDDQDPEAGLRAAREIVDREYERLTGDGERPFVSLREVEPASEATP